ncbi:PP2C-like domain-containing protein CG9801 isoform X2 [Leptinotarsa decemlineata]|uniref:PP2C-like domain-containing protein CG9801 isoform X2 n=1 Tax=Leptinotarsa decemlineata TaxID=7539 RepID=UPI003D305598
MPSLRKRVSSYFRQLSFHNETRDKRHNINENSFVTKYLLGQITLRDGPPIIYGKNPTDLPNYDLDHYESGSNTVIGCYSGPNGGLTTVKRTEKHLSMLDADIDYIDTHDDEPVSTNLPKKSPNKLSPGQPIDNTAMIIKVAGHEYCVINKPKRRSKSLSLGSISDFNIEIEKTKIDKSFYCTNNNNCESVECKNIALNDDEIDCNDIKEISPKDPHIPIRNSEIVPKCKEVIEKKPISRTSVPNRTNLKQRNNDKTEKPVESYELSTSKSDETTENSTISSVNIDDSMLPNEWNEKSDFFYGISDSLYDRNQVSRNKNGDPIADCFGLIARKDSAILAVADGVNWGEKASIAAKSAVHGSLHYLNKTIFNDTKPFENLTIKTDESSTSSSIVDESINLISNTREVFICLLRAFNCAHDLILENRGMLTTLTVAVILPLKQKLERRVVLQNGEERRETEIQYVCCVCNVGDTLAYVYSQKYGVRELTKGSHDINCNRDMRDALGALGPVDGINPELSNLTLSITTIQKGDIVMVASDGLTDNFDPNVCKFTVNTEPTKSRRPSTNKPPRGTQSQVPVEIKQSVVKPIKVIETIPKPPIKPPRKSKNRDDSSRSSTERNSIKSNTISEKSSSPSVENMTFQNKTNDSLSLIKHSEVSNIIHNNTSADARSAERLTSEAPYKTLESSSTSTDKPKVDYDNPLVAAFIRENSVEDSPKINKNNKKPTVVENKASSLRRQASSQLRQETVQSSHKSVAQPSSKTLQSMEDTNRSVKKTGGNKFSRSKTTIDIRASTSKQILRNEDGVPYITPVQRYELQLLLIEDILKNGISGKDSPCNLAKRLCEILISYTVSITSAKRHSLEDQDLYFDHKNGVLVEVSSHEKKIRRKKGLEKVQNLPGKLDHVTVVAYNVGHFAHH